MHSSPAMDPEPPESMTPEEVDAWLESVIREHYKALYNYAYSLARNEADAADLTQQVTITLATRWQNIKDRSKTKSWLFTCLYREFLKLKRKDQNIVAIDDETTHATPEPLVAPARQDRSSDARSAIEAIHSLKEPHRSVLSLYYLEDLSYREIAEVLELPTGTVMSRLSRAKDAIRQILSPVS